MYTRLDAGSLSSWMSMPGFRLESITFDWLHNIYLGTARDICASGILTLVKKDVFPVGSRDMDQILAFVHREIRSTCKAHGMPSLLKYCLPLLLKSRGLF